MAHDNDVEYWQNKILFFLHDPPDKALSIQGHEDRAKRISELLVPSKSLTKEEYSAADRIAASLARAALPGYSKDPNKNGAVDLQKDSLILTHPLVKAQSLVLEPGRTGGIAGCTDEIINILKDDLGTPGQVLAPDTKETAFPLGGYYRDGNSAEWYKVLYFYLFFAFRKRLRLENVGGLGALWDVLPADTRMPDHSIWEHCGMTAALGSILGKNVKGGIALSTFSITPVQGFISASRKLRDAWVSSVLLSYLSFVGMRTIMEELGPDHIVYPSLQDQYLVEQWIGERFHLNRFLQENEDISKNIELSKTIGSFPNKFVFLCDAAEASMINDKIAKAIKDEWVSLADSVKSFLWDKRERALGKVPAQKIYGHFADLFDKEISDYWNFTWASSKMFSIEDINSLQALMDPSIWEREQTTIRDFNRINGDKGKNLSLLYGTSHSFIGNIHAAQKRRPNQLRHEPQGEKCPLCGELEVLNDADIGKEHPSLNAYNEAVRDFWSSIREQVGGHGQEDNSELGEHERLCAVCATKRFLPSALQANKRNSLLGQIFGREQNKFPSTTEIALSGFFKKLEQKNIQMAVQGDPRNKLTDYVHKHELDQRDIDDFETDPDISPVLEQIRKEGLTLEEVDRYYALLLMDGDHMGDLINGATIEATWKDVLHPALRNRFEQGFFPDSPLQNHLHEKRTTNPSVHAAVSDALNSFSRFVVAPIIEKYPPSRLIYAGGDDVLAIVPTEYVLEVASAIHEAYGYSFVKYRNEGNDQYLQARQIGDHLTFEALKDVSKLGLHLGKPEIQKANMVITGKSDRGISISAAIVIAHHKEPLREVIHEAHEVLDTIAKERAGRDTLAIRLHKRNGASRDLWFQWEQQNYFLAQTKPETLSKSLADVKLALEEGAMSSRLAYRMGELQEQLLPLWALDIDEQTRNAAVLKILEYAIAHSNIDSEHRLQGDKVKELAAQLAGLCIIGNPQTEENWFNAEAPVIARFLASSGSEGAQI
ncbi:MAG TPA: type III-B CRISPR-associated protein Cas10/Cmr2 [Rectinema sp.]|nr:type III-B CRISPR-associated protein Cas10/Cmr2 [Rectinema sp.]